MKWLRLRHGHARSLPADQPLRYTAHRGDDPSDSMSASLHDHDRGQPSLEVTGQPSRRLGSCGHDCEACVDPMRADGSDTMARPFSGWSLGLVAAVYFVFPLCLAVTAAALTRGNIDRQAAIAVAALLLGMALTAAGARLWTRRQLKETHHG